MAEFIDNSTCARGLHFRHATDSNGGIYVHLTELASQDKAIRDVVIENLESYAVLTKYVIYDKTNEKYARVWCWTDNIKSAKLYHTKSGVNARVKHWQRKGHNVEVREIKFYDFQWKGGTPCAE